MKHLEEILIDSVEIAHGKWLKITHDTVELPNGKTAYREYIKHSGAVAVIAITNDNQIIMEYQYRHPARQIMLEIPAGKLELGEDLLLAAKRELEEETGFTSNNWLQLGSCLPCIGYSTEKITYYLATNLISGHAKPDDGEFIETVIMDIDECFNLAYSGVITDSKTLSGLMLYQGYLLKQR